MSTYLTKKKTYNPRQISEWIGFKNPKFCREREREKPVCEEHAEEEKREGENGNPFNRDFPAISGLHCLFIQIEKLRI